MKKMKLIRWLGILLVLALVLIPATPALAWNDITFAKTSALIGESVTFTGVSFPASAPGSPVYAIIYFSNENTALVGQAIGTNVLVYSTVAQVQTSTTGTCSGTVTIPTKYSSNNANVAPGTHTMYVTVSSAPTTIVNKYTFTIIGNATIAVSPAAGKVDSSVTVSGTNYLASTAVTITFDGITTTPVSGGTTTVAGALSAVIVVPEVNAGSHTISVSDGTSTKTATFTVQPDILITPQSGAAGATVLVSGTGFGRRVVPTIYFNSLPVTTVSPVLTDTSGTFTTSFIVPSTITTAGSYTVEADDGTNLATASFTLTVAAQPTPTSSATPTTTTPAYQMDVTASGSDIGAAIMVSGTGFAASSNIIVSFGSQVVATETSNATGNFIAQFLIPAVASGDHVITVTDGTNTATETFTVTATPPAAPTPSGPTTGATIKPSGTFTWQTAAGNGTTYELQIASENTFTTGVLVYVTQIPSNSYQLTELQQLQLAGQAEPYFWRVRAVDTAGNAGAWTASTEFYVAKPFSFPTWAIATVAVVGAVLIFGVGYLVGRRTAFYY